MRDLNKHVIDLVTTKWYELGLELLETEHEKELAIIETNCNSDVRICCRKMFNKWLDIQSDASWGQLIQAVKDVELNSAVADIQQLLEGEYGYCLVQDEFRTPVL